MLDTTPTKQKIHTFVVSDLHLSDAEPAHPERPLWKKFRRKEYFIDKDFELFLTTIMEKTHGETIELILNGDIFDFDSVCATPEHATFDITRRERFVGLLPTEEKSEYKINRILQDHQKWVQALANFIGEGHSVVFIIGNHDIELYWPKVQDAIIKHLNLNEPLKHHVRFCEWYYVSQNDSLIEHGHQYDPYCMCLDPIHPIIKRKGKFLIRLPFGNLANRNMVNGMGLKNPHSDDSFIKSSFEFASFFFKYEMKVQPFMIFTWFFGAMKTLFTSLHEGHLPSLKDPLTLDGRMKMMSQKSNSTPTTLLALRDNHAHPAVHHPLSVLRELWLDRAFLILIIVWGCWQIFTTSHVFANVSLWWFTVPLMCSIPFFLYYAHGVQSDVRKNALKAIKHAPLSAKTCNVKRVIHGHTHKSDHFWVNDTEYINTGTWSPRFKDVECEQETGMKHFAWLNPNQMTQNGRVANLYSWKAGTITLHPTSPGQKLMSDSEESPINQQTFQVL